jgi:hypothetical protein
MKTIAYAMGKRLAARMIEYIREDQQARYGLNETVSATFTGAGIGIGNFDNGVLKIESSPGCDAVKLTARPFPASSGRWNGPDIIPDDWAGVGTKPNFWRDLACGAEGEIGPAVGSMEASLWHDLIWGSAREIGAACGMRKQDVLKWGNGILYAAWIGYAKTLYPDAVLTRQTARVGFWACEWGRRIYHPVKRAVASILKVLGVVAVCVAVSGCGGCASPPDWVMVESDEIEWGVE